jgi:hypothetical protein
MLGVMAFEYTTSVVTRGFMGRNVEELKRSDLEGGCSTFGSYVSPNVEHPRAVTPAGTDPFVAP